VGSWSCKYIEFSSADNMYVTEHRVAASLRQSRNIPAFRMVNPGNPVGAGFIPALFLFNAERR